MNPQLPALGLLILSCLSLNLAQAQVSGQVSNSQKEPLPGATILLLSAADSSLVKGQLSGEKGTFSFESMDPGEYTLQVSMLGFSPFWSEKWVVDNAGNGKKDFGNIVLLEASTELSTVNVLARKPLFEQKIDRVVVNVGASATNAGGNALQVLQRSPGVLVNRQANGISIAGKNGIIIMINGKISRMPPDAIIQMLEGTASANIERIELIHTPPANFDAEGSAGIINIVLKQSAEAGLNGGYSLNLGYGRREKAGGGLHFNYRQRKVNLFGSYSYQFDHNPQVFTNYRGIERDGQFLETDGVSTRAPDLGIHNARLGADFQLSEKTVVGVIGTFFNRYWDMDAHNVIDLRTNNALENRIQMSTHEINQWRSGTANANIAHQISKTKSLSADVDYVYYKIHNPSDYDIKYQTANGVQTKESQLRVGKETPISILVGKLDYVEDFSKNTRFETGVKLALSRFDNDVQVEEFELNDWITDTSLTSRFKLREDVSAAYSSIGFKLNPKTDVKLGLRYEYTSTNLGSPTQPDVVDRQYGSWFPTVYLARTLTEKQSINLSYSRRIARPGFTQLAPYLIFYDPNTLQTGNPALQPAFVDALRVSYQYKTFNWVAEYNLETPSIRDIPVVNVAQNSQVTLPVNIGKTHTVFSFLSFPIQVTKWWSMQQTFFAVYQDFIYDYEGVSDHIASGFAGIQASQSFTLPRQTFIDLSANMVTANYYGLTKYKTNGVLSLGVRKKISDRWGELTLNVNDILLSSNYFGSANQPELNLKVRNSFEQAERVFMLTWSNKFGNQKLKDARQRDRGASEELRRL